MGRYAKFHTKDQRWPGDEEFSKNQLFFFVLNPLSSYFPAIGRSGFSIDTLSRTCINATQALASCLLVLA